MSFNNACINEWMDVSWPERQLNLFLWFLVSKFIGKCVMVLAPKSAA